MREPTAMVEEAAPQCAHGSQRIQRPCVDFDFFSVFFLRTDLVTDWREISSNGRPVQAFLYRFVIHPRVDKLLLAGKSVGAVAWIDRYVRCYDFREFLARKLIAVNQS